jgi:uncharacterized membrane protein
VDDLERAAARRCADAVVSLQAVARLLEATDVDALLRLTAALDAVRAAERAAQELRLLVVELALDRGASPGALGHDPED